MSNTKEIRKLIYSLEMISEFSDNVDAVNSSEEFFKIHNRNSAMLLKMSVDRNSDYFVIKVNEYPKLTESEIDEFIKDKQKAGNLILAMGGWIVYLIVLLFKTAKTKGNNLGGTKNKLQAIKSINNSLIYVIKNPGFEELIKEKNAL